MKNTKERKIKENKAFIDLINIISLAFEASTILLFIAFETFIVSLFVI